MQKCKKKGKFLKNFQFQIVKSPFFDVKTYEKLTFFIVFLDWQKIMLNQKAKKGANFEKIQFSAVKLSFFYVKTFEK